ncbi:MAG: HU family DNA-binding protein, partial [Actinomycetia bacterium]|nr:HU family DNA-binding protein [Actinomycetes bacterium]
MNKSELVDAVAEKAGLSKKDVAGTIDALQDVIGETL